MQQAISAFNSADQAKVIDAAGDKRKEGNSQSGKEQDDLNALASFLQILNQQMNVTSQINKDSRTAWSELQQTLANFEKSVHAGKTGKDENGQWGFRAAVLLQKISAVDSKLASGDMKAQLETAINIIADQTAGLEAELKAQNEEKLSFLKSDQETFQAAKTLSREGQVSANQGSKVSLQEIKQSLISKDNLRFVQEQYESTSVPAKTGNEVEIETIQTAFEELFDNFKAEHKGKTTSSENENKDISFASVNAGGSDSGQSAKINNAERSAITSQIAAQIKGSAVTDGGRVKIILNPPSLGTVEMDVIVHHNKVEVVLVADNRDVQQTLNNSIDQLKSSLQTQGLTIERCDVFMQDKQEEYQHNFSDHAFQRNESGHSGSGRQDDEQENDQIQVSISAQQTAVIRLATDNISLFA